MRLPAVAGSVCWSAPALVLLLAACTDSAPTEAVLGAHSSPMAAASGVLLPPTTVTFDDIDRPCGELVDASTSEVSFPGPFLTPLYIDGCSPIMANFPSPPKALRFLAAPNSITFAPPVGHVSVYVTTFDPGFPITLRAFDPDGNELASSTVANPPRPSGYSGFVPVAVEVGDNQIASVRVDGQLLPDNTTFTVIDDLSYRRWGSLYAFDGFFQPVDNGTVNKVNAGSAVPVKFSLGGDFGLDVLAAGSPTSAAYTCDGSAQDVIEQTVTASTSSLSFKAGTNQYVYVWKTEKVWANTCRVFTLTLADNSTHTARFRFTR